MHSIWRPEYSIPLMSGELVSALTIYVTGGLGWDETPVILLSQPPKYQDYRYEPPCPLNYLNVSECVILMVRCTVTF